MKAAAALLIQTNEKSRVVMVRKKRLQILNQKLSKQAQLQGLNMAV